MAFGYFLDRVNDGVNRLLKQMGAEETDEVVDARDKWKAEKEVIRHKKFKSALLKLSDEKNRKTAVECLDAGESVDVEIEGVMEEFCDGKKTKHRVRSSLYGMALSEGWLDIVAKCLDLGASPVSKIDFISLDGPTAGTVHLSMSPIEIANAQVSSVTQTKLLNLLERRGSK